MNVLCDYHHPALWESMRLLFRKRLGYFLYRPVGMEWFDENYWEHEKSWAKSRFAHMFLDHKTDDQRIIDMSFRFGTFREGGQFSMLTVEQAMELKPDVVISTVPGNHAGFNRFAQEVGAVHIVQIGNNEHPIDFSLDAIFLDSTNHYAPPNIRYYRYDQEIDTNLYHYEKIVPDGPVSSFLVEWHDDDRGLEKFSKVSELLAGNPGFRLYGNRGAMLDTNEQVAAAMKASSAVYHTKKIGDGWGHVIHSAFAMGRPVISIRDYYKGMRGFKLMQRPDIDYLEIGYMTPTDISRKIRQLVSDVDRMREMGYNASSLFESVVNYGLDAQEIRRLVEA